MKFDPFRISIDCETIPDRGLNDLVNIASESDHRLKNSRILMVNRVPIYPSDSGLRQSGPPSGNTNNQYMTVGVARASNP
jgi:hypothetical protein